MEHAQSLLQLNTKIKSLLQSHLGGYHWVIAEIGSMQIARQGHCYLEMVEQENGQTLAKNRATIWAGQFGQISRDFSSITGESLKQGISILFCCSINYHEVYGLSLNITSIDPSYTLGERARKRAETLQKLTEEGIIDLNKRITLPRVLQKVAVISSPTAAGYGDFLNQLQGNNYGYAVQTELFPATMQGNEAAESIANQLLEVGERTSEFDLVAIIRGGGSQLDLDCFDSYKLAFAIAHSKLPVITGIGHQRDDTVADTVARLKLKTPTAVAEYILQSFELYETELIDSFQEIIYLANQQLNLSKEKVSNLQLQLFHQSNSRLKDSGNELKMIQLQLQNALQSKIKNEQNELRMFSDKLMANDPEQILQKGYSISLVNGKPLHLQKLSEGMEMSTRSKTQIILSSITKIENNNE